METHITTREDVTAEAAFDASVHLAREAVADDPFDEWEAEPVAGFRLTEA